MPEAALVSSSLPGFLHLGEALLQPSSRSFPRPLVQGMKRSGVWQTYGRCVHTRDEPSDG